MIHPCAFCTQEYLQVRCQKLILFESSNILCLDTLNYLVHMMSLDEFVRILPGGEMACDSPVFKPFVKACENVQSANYLRSLIMETGEKLLTTLELN
jgi:hypothetical protein